MKIIGKLNWKMVDQLANEVLFDEVGCLKNEEGRILLRKLGYYDVSENWYNWIKIVSLTKLVEIYRELLNLKYNK